MQTGEEKMNLQSALFLGLLGFLQLVRGELEGKTDPSAGDATPCSNDTQIVKCSIDRKANASQTDTWKFSTNGTRKYFAFEHFDLHENDEMLLFHGDSQEASLLTGNFSGKSDPFIAVAFSSDATLVFKASSDQYPRSFTIDYNTNVCEVMVNQVSGIIKAPVYSPASSALLNCTYHISTSSSAGHIAMSFDKLNLTKGSLLVWDGKTRTDPLVVNSTGRNIKTVADVVSSKKDLVLEAALSTSNVETFSANFLTENQDCTGGTFDLTEAKNLTSPGFPNKNYDNNLDCRWIAVAPKGYTIRLDIESVDLADALDNVAINDGDAKASDPLLNINTGYKQLGLLMSSSNRMLIRFRTDESQTGKGFSIKLTPQPYGGFASGSGRIALKQHDHSNKTTLEEKALHEGIQSPPVYFLLQAHLGYQVRLEMNDSFLMPTSSVDFLDGAKVNSPLIGHFRSDKPAYPVVSSGNQMLVKVNGFYNNGTATSQRFIADFTSVLPGSQFSLSGESGGASLKYSGVNMTATYIIVNPTNDSLVSLKVSTVFLPMANATVTIYPAASDQVFYLLQLNGSTEGESIQSLPVIYTNEARIVYDLKSTSGLSPDTVLLSFSFQTVPVCVQQIDGSHTGSLISPQYPNMYPINAQCSWTFNPEHDKVLRLNFKKFALALGDTLKIEVAHESNNSHSVLPRTEVLGNLTGSLDEIPDMIIPMRNTSNDTTQVKITFDASFKGSPDYLRIAQGFRIDYQQLVCGGNLTDDSKSVQTPNYPNAVDSDSLICVWVIDLPSNSTTDNTSVNIIKYQFDIQHFSEDTNTSMSLLEARDGASEIAPLVTLKLKNGDSGAILSRVNRLWVRYTFNRTKGDKHQGFAVKLSYSTNTCTASNLCDNGVCMHSDWKCNGKDECGDDSDERNCYHATKGISGLVLGMAIVVTFIIATALACVVPAIYKRMKYPNYSELRDLMTPVPT